MFASVQATRPRVLLVSVLIANLSATVLIAQQAPQSARTSGHETAQLEESYGKLPLNFEANAGQTDTRVRFYSRGSGYDLYLTSDEAVLALNKTACAEQAAPKSLRPDRPGAHLNCTKETSVVTMRLAGNLSPGVNPTGEETLPGTANYFVGSDPDAWRTAVPTYAKVRYSNVYPGVDLLYYGNQRQLEYDFAVAPFANPKAIRLQFSGVTKLKLDSSGDLIVSEANGNIAFRKPVIYQEHDGRRNFIAGNFVLGKRHTVSFSLSGYDHSQPLVIDPVLAYSTYIGGNGSNGDTALAIVVDASGDAYITGQTDSTNFPLTSGSYQQTNHGAANSTFNAFVTKLNPTGTALLYSTYLGGSGNTQASAMAVDSSGNAYVTGTTFATNFPTTSGAYQTASPASSAGYTAFVTRLNSTGTALGYSTYLGGSGNGSGTGEGANALLVDSSGNAYVAGYAYSTNFPVTAGAFQTANNAATTSVEGAFVTKLNSTGSGLVYSTYLSGSGNNGQGDTANALALDSSGDIYVTGSAGSTNFPTTAGAYQTANPAAANSLNAAFVSELNPTGTALLYSTYLGGSQGAAGSALAIDVSGNAYIAGYTMYTDFPVTPGAFQTTNNAAANFATNAFVAKLNPAGSALLYSTLLGGSGVKISTFNTDGDSADGLAIDAYGDVYVTGTTFSADFPVTSGAYQTTSKAAANRANSAYVTELNPTGTALVYSTYIGGSGYPFGSMNYYRGDSALGLALDASGNVYIAGTAYSSDYPVTTGSFQAHNKAVNNSGSNAFVSKLSINTPIATTTSLTSSANPTIAGNSIAFTANVTASSGTTTPAGSVVFTVDGATVATVAMSSGAATYSTSGLSTGSHSIIASYGATALFTASTSATLTETVNPAPPQTTAPAFSPAVGTYTAAQAVILSDATTGAAIYYTTNGATPTTSSTRYSAAIPVGSTETIEALAVASGYTNSIVVSGTYTINLPIAATPAFSVAAGTYINSQSVMLSATTAGAIIYYTTDGTTPTTSSPMYTTAISVSATAAIEAIAVVAGYTNSAVASALYTITPPAATPTFSVPAGSYSPIQSVAILDSTSGANIYYTTDGTAPTTSSTKYTAAISLSATTTVNAIAAATGYSNSAVASIRYNVAAKPASPAMLGNIIR